MARADRTQDTTANYVAVDVDGVCVDTDDDKYRLIKRLMRLESVDPISGKWYRAYVYYRDDCVPGTNVPRPGVYPAMFHCSHCGRWHGGPRRDPTKERAWRRSGRSE